MTGKKGKNSAPPLMFFALKEQPSFENIKVPDQITLGNLYEYWGAATEENNQPSPNFAVQTVNPFFISLADADEAVFTLTSRINEAGFVVTESEEVPIPEDGFYIIAAIEAIASKRDFKESEDNFTFCHDDYELCVAFVALSIEYADKKILNLFIQGLKHGFFTPEDSMFFSKSIQYIGKNPEIVHLDEVEWIFYYAFKKDTLTPLFIKRLYEQYEDKIPRWNLFKEIDPQLAEDLIQDFYERMLKTLPKTKINKLSPFIYSVAAKTVNNHWRKVYKERRKLNAYSKELNEKDSYQPPEDHELKNILKSAISRLPEKYRPVLELFFWNGLSVKEISKKLECPQGTVKSRLSRARTELRRDAKLLDYIDF